MEIFLSPITKFATVMTHCAGGRALSNVKMKFTRRERASERARMGIGSNSGQIIERERKGGLCEVGSKDFAPTERPSDVLAFCAWLSQKKEGIGQPVCKPFKPFFGRDK